MLTDEQREALGKAMYGQSWSGPLNGPLAEATERIVSEQVEAARAEGYGKGWNEARSIDIPTMDAERDRANRAEAAERALVDLLNYLDRQGCLVHEASCHCIGTTRPCTCRLADLRAALTHPTTEATT